MSDEEVVAPVEGEAVPTPAEEQAAPKVELPKPYPRVGNAVEYVRDDYSHLEEGASESAPVTAVILAVHDEGAVTLNAGGATVSPVAYDKGGAAGTWHWPEPEKKTE